MSKPGLRTSVHHHIWRRLPRSFRREVLFHGAGLLAPRPTPSAAAQLPIIVVGVLHSSSGLGASARLCHDALKDLGFPVYGIDLTSALMQAADLPGFVFSDGRHSEGPGTIILHVNSPLVPVAMLRLGRRLVREKRIIGYWAWELPEVPPDWRHGVPFVHEIWVPSRFTAHAVTGAAKARPIHVVPHPVAHKSQQRTVAHTKDRPFTVLCIFNMASSFARKNPLAAIDAFRRAFGDDPSARMILKYSNPDSYPEGLHQLLQRASGHANICLLGEAMSAADVDALYAQADAVISLHRSEGFGLVPAEAMMRGLPVIATDWSGTADFITESTGIPIPYRLIPARDPQGTYDFPDLHWAEADVGAAALALRRLRDDADFRCRLGQQGAATAGQLFSPEAYGNRVSEILGL